MLKGGSCISHGAVHRPVNFFQVTKEYLKVNKNILTTTEGYGTQIYSDHIIQMSRIIAF